LHLRIALGLVVGTVLGGIVHALAPDHWLVGWSVTYFARPIGQIFLRLLFLLVLPLVFSALALGVAELGDPRKLGRIGLVTLLYTAVLSAVAVALGVAVVNLLQPGIGIDPAVREQLLAGAAERASTILASPPKSGVDLLVGIVPNNVVRAAADNDMLAVMFASALLGVALTMVHTPGAVALRDVLQGIADVAMYLIGLVIQLAPIGVAALMYALTVELGVSILVQLGWFVAAVLLGLGLQQFVVFPLVVWGLGKMHPLAFFRGVQPAMLTAFSTASSSATLPTTLAVADEMGLPKDISRFVLTVGATANQNGTALFEGVTVLFLAQFYGVDLDVGTQLLVAGVCVLGGIGTAGVPAGSLPVVAMILGMIGVPPEGIGLVLGVDRLLDMCRTTLNVTGDLAATVVVSRIERG
jgi:Na+/H+-dicarboxylate symporter